MEERLFTYEEIIKGFLLWNNDIVTTPDGFEEKRPKEAGSDAMKEHAANQARWLVEYINQASK